jgi:hypothetical protein
MVSRGDRFAFRSAYSAAVASSMRARVWVPLSVRICDSRRRFTVAVLSDAWCLMRAKIANGLTGKPVAVSVICYGGRQVGSPNILGFIRETQPLLGSSGHIHESPYQPGGKWAARVGRTRWFQPGQEGQKLDYVGLEITYDLDIKSAEHSIFDAFRS